VLLDQEHRGGPRGRELAQRRAELPHDHRREALHRLVEQHHARVHHQRARDREHLLLAAGEAVAGARPPRGQCREHLVGPGDGVWSRARDGREVLVHVERRKHAALLRHPADAGARAAPRGLSRQVAASEAHRASRAGA
jgi:hypothetical protein